jgi:AcrR family transcriptional regulator
VETEISDAKQRVLEHAGRLFMEKGYAAVTLRDLADALGVRQASLYYHFPEGKEQLYVEMVERVFARHQVGLEQAIGCAPPVLAAQLHSAANWLGAQPTVHIQGMMYADLPALSQANARRVSQIVYAALFGPLRTLFAAAQARGETRPVNPDLMAGFFLALMDGIAFSLTQQQDLPRAALVAEAIALMLDGIAPRHGLVGAVTATAGE